MSSHPSDVLDLLAASGQEPGGAVAVVRDGVVECDHSVGTRDGVLAVDLRHAGDDLLGRQALRRAGVPRRRARGGRRPRPTGGLRLARVRPPRQGRHDDATPALPPSGSPGVPGGGHRPQVRRPRGARGPLGERGSDPSTRRRCRRARPDLRSPAGRGPPSHDGRATGRAVRTPRRPGRLGPAPARRGARPRARRHARRARRDVAVGLPGRPAVGPRAGPTAGAARRRRAELRELPAHSVPRHRPARQCLVAGDVLRLVDRTRRLRRHPPRSRPVAGLPRTGRPSATTWCSTGP